MIKRRNGYSVRIIAGAAGGLLLLASAGCDITLATLENGDEIKYLFAHEETEIVDGKEVRHRREPAIGFVPREGEEQWLTLGRPLLADQDTFHPLGGFPLGFDVRRRGDEITVWSFHGSERGAVATLTQPADAPAVLAEPSPGVAYEGDRLGCMVMRPCATVRVAKHEYLLLGGSSTRDAGKPDDNDDCFGLVWFAEQEGKPVQEWKTLNADLLTLEGDQCLPDPLHSCPAFDIRWHGGLRAAWVVDRETRTVLGGLQTDGLTFGPDDRPAYATPTGGDLIARVGE